MALADNRAVGADLIASSPPALANSGDMHFEAAAADVSHQSLNSSMARSSIFTPLSVLPALSFESGCFGLPSSPSSYSYSPLPAYNSCGVDIRALPGAPPLSPTGLFAMPPISPGPFSPGQSLGGPLYDHASSRLTASQTSPSPGPYHFFNSLTDISAVAHGVGSSGKDGEAVGATASAADDEEVVKAVVEEAGYISLKLRYDTRVDIAPNQAIRVVNPRKSVTLGLSGCATQMAMVHPQGRVLQYNSRIEVQVESYPSIKNAKMWPKGVSFTSNNSALVYLVDSAGARSTTDTFHDLYAENIADTVFMNSSQVLVSTYNATIEKCIHDLEEAQYWRTPDTDLDCWLINGVSIKQTADGLVTVDRQHGNEKFSLRTSPSNGKVRLGSSFLYLTASMGEEAHVFIKSNERRIHYNGSAFVVRNAGHSAGFDESGLLRIW